MLSSIPWSNASVTGFAIGSLLAQSLTHRSHAQTPRQVDSNNERLEFLGDSVLGLVVSQRLMERCPELPEGHLTKLKASLVCAENLVDVARRLKLGAYLRIGRGEEISGGRNKKGLLEDALEALIAAIYLDGGLEAASSFFGPDGLERHGAGSRRRQLNH